MEGKIWHERCISDSSYLDVCSALLDIARGGVVHSEKDIEALDQRALSIAASAVLVPFSLPFADIVEHAIWQTGCSHVLASGEERTQDVEEDVRVIFLVHPCEHGGEVPECVTEAVEERCQTLGVVDCSSTD